MTLCAVTGVVEGFKSNEYDGLLYTSALILAIDGARLLIPVGLGIGLVFVAIKNKWFGHRVFGIDLRDVNESIRPLLLAAAYYGAAGVTSLSVAVARQHFSSALILSSGYLLFAGGFWILDWAVNRYK
jgi:hypothetical protein